MSCAIDRCSLADFGNFSAQRGIVYLLVLETSCPMQDTAAQPLVPSLAFGRSAVGTHSREVAVEGGRVDPAPVGDVSHADRPSDQQRNRVWYGKPTQMSGQA